jgi:integral membrane protein (TIGR01906 family)
VGLFRTLVIGLFIIAVPVALITTTIRVAISEQSVYDYSVRHYDAERTAGIPESELIRANGEIRDYVNGGDGPLSITVTNLAGEQERLFTPRETAHMADVRDLVGAMFTVQVAAVAIVLTLAVVMIALWPPRALVAASLYGGVLTAVVLGFFGALAVSGFDSAWSQFHGIAFSNDLWKLDPDTDHLIQMYPEAFWQRITFLLGAVILLQALLISAASSAYLILSRPVQGERLERPRPEVAGAPGRGRPRIARPNPRHYVR